MKQLLLKQLTTKRLILLVLSFIMLMPSTAWGKASFYAVLSADGKTVTFYYDENEASRGGQNIFMTPDRFYAEATTAVIDESMANYAPADMTAWFFNCSALTSITGLENLNTSEVRNMQSLFQGCSSLTSLDLTGFDTSNLINMNGMFAECSSLKSVDLSSFNTSKVTDMGGLFAYCSDLETIYVDETRWSTAAVTSENNGNGALFLECGPLVGGNGTAYYDTYEEDLAYARVDKPGQPGYLTHKDGPAIAGKEPYAVLSENNTVLTFYYDTNKDSRGGLGVGPFTKDADLWGVGPEKITHAEFDASFANCTSITSTAYWFCRCTYLETIDGIEYLNTANVTDMSNMFSDCVKLTSLDVSKFNTCNVTNMENMFASCRSLTSLDVSKFDTHNVTSMEGMFSGCAGLTSLDVSHFDTKKVTLMNKMFNACESLKSLDLSNFDTDLVTKFDWMFRKCTNLSTIYCDKSWVRDYVTSLAMFKECTNLPGYDVSRDEDNYPLKYAKPIADGGYFTPTSEKEISDTDPEPYAVLSENNTVLTFYYDNQKAERNGMDVGPFSKNSSWYEQRQSITSVVFDDSFANCTTLTSTAYWFDGLKNLSSISGIGNLKTDNVTNMGGMFRYCSSLTSLDVTGFKTDKVTDMGGMFLDCSGLTSLDVTGFKTDNAIFLDGMFYGCSSLTSLDVTGFKTDILMTMYWMFHGCSGLTSLDLSSFNTARVADMNRVFDYCSSLTTIYVGDGWSTKSVRGGEHMFEGCTSLKGGSGTVYDDNHTDYTYAHIDGGTDNPGYLTKKGSPATESCDMSEIPTDNAYYAATSFLCERGVLDGSKVGGKYLVEDPLLRKHLANISFRGLFTLKGREIPSTFVSDQYPDVYDDLKSDSSYYQAAKVLLYLDYGDGITPFDRDRDGFFPDGNEARINILKELMEAFNIKPDTVGTDNPFPKDPDITSLSESSPIKMGYVRQAAKLGIITTDNEKFRPYDDCLRGEAFLMLTRIIQKIEAGEIADPNPKESDFLDPNSGTGTAEPYAVLSDDNTVLTFYYDDQKAARNGMGIGPFTDYSNRGWDNSNLKITTAVFDPSFANCMTITSTAFWFSGCMFLTSITGLQYLKTDNVTDMKRMFYGCQKLENVDLSGFITDKVTDMSYMLSGCWKLTNLDLSGFNTSNVTNMSNMFAESSGLQSLDVSGFNTSKVTDMSWMFSGVSSVKRLELRGFNTSNVTNMSNMFRYCCGMSVIDISSFKTDNVTVMDKMFHECYGLKTIYVGDLWSTAAVTSSTDMFDYDTRLVGGAGSGYYACDAKDHTAAHIDGGADNPGYFTYVIQPYASLSPDNTTLTFYYDDQKEYRGGMGVGPFSDYDERGWYEYTSTITSVVFEESFADCISLRSTAYWFGGLSALTTIKSITNLNTENVTSMSFMFDGCSSLISLDLSHFNTENVTSMNFMLNGCSSLTSLDLSHFNTANVTYFDYMFSGCSSLTSLDLSGFVTDKAVGMPSMFEGCSGLTTIYAGDGWSTTEVMWGLQMFSGCTSLVGGAGTKYDANNIHYTYARIDGGESNPGYFTYKNATPVEDDSEPYAVLSNDNTVLTFYYDSKKESRGGVSVGPFADEKDRVWNTYRESISSVVFDESFAKCTTLTSTAYWFYECSSLTGITGISNLKTDHVTDMKFMFHGCESLTSIDVSGFKTDNVENIQGMFFRCEQLTSMDLSGFNTEKVTNMSALFSRCVGMTSVDLSGFKTDLVTSMRLMFNQCSSLTSLNLTDFNTGKVTDMGYMFADCSRLKTIYISKTGWDLSQLLDGTKMFENCTSLVGGAGTKYDASHVDYTYAHIDGGTANPGYFTEKDAPVVVDNSKPYAVFDNGTLTFYYDEEKESRGGMSVGPFALDDERWDGYSANITTVVFDPSFAKCTSLTSTAYWFFECYNLTTIKGIENLKTGNVTDMSAMFYQCSSLTSLDLANWDTRNVTNMMCMFMCCYELTSLNLMGFNTAKVTDMDCMFRSCRKLGSLLLNDFDTGNVTNMRFMFLDCPNLIALDVSSFNTSKVTNMSSMFKSCSKLTALDVTCFNTSSVTDMGYMFSDCPSLKTIDVSSFDTKNVTDFRCMFYGCSELSTIYCNDTWNSEAESSQMFDGCEKLVGGNGTTYDADHKDGTYARVDGGADAPGYFTTNGVVDENIEYKYGEGTGLVVHAAKDDTMELYIKGTVTVDDVECPVTAIGERAFENNTVLEEVSIPATITSFGEKAFAGCINLKAIYVYIRIPVDITSSKARTRGDGVSTVFEGVDTETCTLYVPAGSGDSYRNAEGWKEFKNIVEMGESCEITIGKNGKTTFCGNTGLDFNGTDEVKAFIATGFDKESSTIWMTRIMDVPAGVPVMIKGEANTTYNIPVTDGGTSYYKNMFVGNTSGETISISETSEDGKYVNYYMSGGQFKSVNTSANIGNNKCYLQLPANLGAESTGEPLQVKIAASGKSSFAAPYDLDFTSLNDDVKAFTATGYDKSSKTIWLTRVKKVQKGEGLLLKGTGGETYTIPSSGVQAAYVNMIVGNISGENLEIGETSKNGTLTNYYLKGGTYVSVSGTANIGTNKSYLQLPTYMLAGARSEDAVNVSDVQTTYNVVELETESMPIIFASIGHDDNGTTGIQSMFNDQSSMFNDQWYTLSGQRISKPTKSGLYIHQGKVVIK